MMKIVLIGNTEVDPVMAAAVAGLRKAGHVVALPVNALSEPHEFARLIEDADEIHVWTIDKFLLGMVYMSAVGDGRRVKLFCHTSEVKDVKENRILAALIAQGAILETVT